jgi:DNA-3-methyladenine glycosylase I
VPERCVWPGTDPLYLSYHDEEWGVPVHDDRLHFEFLVLEGAQAGLAWITILRKRERYREVFDDFHPEVVGAYDARKVESLLASCATARRWPPPSATRTRFWKSC